MPPTASPPTVRSDDDLAHGATVIIAARWVLVAAGLVLALWNPGELVQLQVAIVLILAIAVSNFAFQMQLLTRGPLVARVVYAASVGDLVVISMLIVVGGGYPAAPYVFYLPALLAIGVTFRTPVAALYTGAAIIGYGLIAAASAEVAADANQAVAVLTELLMLAAVAVCGNVYWRLERQRRGDIAPPVRRSAHRAVVVPLADETADVEAPLPAS